MENEEISNGIRFVWNNLPNNRTDSTIITVPVGFHYQPGRQIENMPLVDYEPVACKQCKSILNPYVKIDFKSKCWDCQFCLVKNQFSSIYAQNISETNLPTELIKEYTTLEYKLNRKETNWPIFIFLIDTCVEEEELLAIKENIQLVVSELPQECSIGVISFGNICQVHELGFAEYPVSYNFKGDVLYKPLEIQEMLGLVNITKTGNLNNVSNSGQLSRYVVPIKDCEFALNTLLDELQVDPFGKNVGERFSNSAGLAIQIAISMLETNNSNDPSRIQLFLGSPTTIGYGQIVSKPLTEVIRNWIDFDKNAENTKYSKPAAEYYTGLATRAAKSGQTIDIFFCSFNQGGILEMRSLTEKTGGVLVMSDSFTTGQFKDTFKKLFDLDESGSLKMNFKGKIEINTSKPIFLSGAIGQMISLDQNAPHVSQIKQYEGGTKLWYLGGFDYNSSYTFLLDMNSEASIFNKFGYIQLLTTYVAGDRSHRLRVTTVSRSILGSLNSGSNTQELIKGFDQESACVMLAKIGVIKGYSEDYSEVLKWLDKCLIRLLTKLTTFRSNDVKSFRLPKELDMFPQFIFYLRRSAFIQHFNASIDEIVVYRTTLLHENVNNCTIMIQPVMYSYTAEQPEATPVFLDIQNMKSDNVLFLDTFFNVIVWHGEEVGGWRDQELHLQEDYSNIKMMLESPQEYAQQLLSERIPVPKFISCDAGSGQERHIKAVVDPSISGSSSKVISDGFASDDVTLSKFMEYLIKVVVSTNS